MTCPHCSRRTGKGSFCEKCGRELHAAADVLVKEAVLSGGRRSDDRTGISVGDASLWCNQEESPSNRMTPCFGETTGDGLFSGGFPQVSRSHASVAESARYDAGAVVLDMDRLSILYENLRGSIRFRLTPPADEVLEDVLLELVDDISGISRSARVPYIDDGECQNGNLIVGFPGMDAGSYVWNVKLSFVRNRLRRVMRTSFELVVVRPENSVSIAEQIVFNINNDIKAEGAADVRVSNRIADELSEVIKGGENPTRVLQRIAGGCERAWAHMKLYDATDRAVLPPVDDEFRTDRVALDFGHRVIKFFSGRTVTFGRNRECDIFLRPKENTDENETDAYRVISRRHCFFEHQGDMIAIYDGWRDETGVQHPSSCGTFLNGECIRGCGVVGKSGEGIVSFAANFCVRPVSLLLKTVSPEKSCAKCPYSDRSWCGNGRRSVVLSRTDGIPETYVCIWSCFHLEEVDPSFNEVVIFRKDGAFAWLRGNQCGWLVPGTTIHTDYGTIKIK